MSEFLLEVDVVFDDDEKPFELTDRATVLPEFDVARFASQAMVDDEEERVTLEIPEETLTALKIKSTPPPRLVGGNPIVRVLSYRERISSENAFALSTPWAPGR